MSQLYKSVYLSLISSEHLVTKIIFLNINVMILHKETSSKYVYGIKDTPINYATYHSLAAN